MYRRNLLQIVRGRGKEEEVELFLQEIKLERNKIELNKGLV